MIKWRVICGMLWLLAGWGAPVAGHAAPGADAALVQQALQNIHQENYEEAVAGLQQAWQQGERSAEVAYYLGLAHGQLGQYDEAQRYLEQAVRRRPDYPEARLLLAEILVARDNPVAAQEHLDYLAERGYQPSRTALAAGQAAMKQKRYEVAQAQFQQAAADPQYAQQAKLSLGQALDAQNRLKESRQVLEEAVNVDPTSVMGGYARRQLSFVEKRAKDHQQFHFYVGQVFDYDSNVTLQPGDAVSAQNISGQGDMVFTQMATMDYQFFPFGTYGLLARYSLFQNFHRRITNYDVLSHSWEVAPSVRFPSSTLWLPVSYTYMDVGSDKYFTGFLFNPTYLHMVTTNVGLEAGFRTARKYYTLPIPFPQEDRSGRDFGGSAGAYYFFKNQKGYLQARASYVRDATGGSNWDSNAYSLLLAALYPVNDSLKLNAFAEMTIQPFNQKWYSGDPTASFPNRYDKILTLGVQGTYDIYKGIEINLHYYFIRDNSNIYLYDYHRHIWGAQLAYRY